jgi:hypothetical protein
VNKSFPLETNMAKEIRIGVRVDYQIGQRFLEFVEKEKRSQKAVVELALELFLEKAKRESEIIKKAEKTF